MNRNLPTFHRYLNLRKRMMGLSELHYYDLYAPLVSSVDLNYTVEEAQKHVLAALAPLGADYAAAATRAFNERWIDMYPTPGKRSGAYSNGGAYDVHPYMLLNYNGKYNDVSTLGARARPRDALATSRTRRSRSRWPAIPSSSPKSPRRSTRRSSTTTC